MSDARANAKTALEVAKKAAEEAEKSEDRLEHDHGASSSDMC